jgi:hypothetical protein
MSIHGRLGEVDGSDDGVGDEVTDRGHAISMTLAST